MTSLSKNGSPFRSVTILKYVVTFKINTGKFMKWVNCYIKNLKSLQQDEFCQRAPNTRAKCGLMVCNISRGLSASRLLGGACYVRV